MTNPQEGMVSWADAGRGSTELSEEVVLPEREDAPKNTLAWEDYTHTDTHT